LVAVPGCNLDVCDTVRSYNVLHLIFAFFAFGFFMLCAVFLLCFPLSSFISITITITITHHHHHHLQSGATLLHAAASSGHIAIMEGLIERGLSVHSQDRLGDTPLHWIPRSGSAASVKLLLDRGSDPNAVNSVCV
jgi:ankyrin repeat protein